MSYVFPIRKYYTPVQPAAEQAKEQVSYTEFWPDSRLANLIYCYWELKSLRSLNEQFVYRVVADGCFDVFFASGNPTESHVMGICRRYTEFPLENTFHYTGIRFLPSVFSQIFKIDASELSNRAERLEFVIPLLSKYIQQHFPANPDRSEVKSLLDRYFLRHLSKQEIDEDKRFYEALNVILKNAGQLHFKSGLDTGISPRQLRRMFKFYIGDSAKTFSKIVRFQNLLSASARSSTCSNPLFFADGYYDQAHFIREFKNLYGTTPGRVFAR